MCAPYGWETVIQLARALAGHAFELRYTKLEHIYLTALDYLNTITTTRTFNNIIFMNLNNSITELLIHPSLFVPHHMADCCRTSRSKVFDDVSGKAEGGDRRRGTENNEAVELLPFELELGLLGVLG